MTEESVLTLEHLTVGYGRLVVLADVNLSLRRGSFTGLLGANGSGKITRQKMIGEPRSSIDIEDFIHGQPGPCSLRGVIASGIECQ